MVERLAAGEFTVQRKRPNRQPTPSTRSQDPDGAVNEGFLYLDSDGNEIATVNYYHLNGIPLSPVDPKAIRVGTKRYVIHASDLDANPEKRMFPGSLSDQIRYGCLRRLGCCLHGPIERIPWRHER